MILKNLSDDMELISVIVPVYNVEKYLLRCVDSVRNQTYTNLEIILVDDGSPDRCPQMCDEIKAEDPRVKVIHQQNAGLGMARNAGMAAATGKYITFIDSDDWISREHIENLHKAMIENNADAVLGNHTRATVSGEYIPRILPLEEGVYEGERMMNEIVLPLLGADLSHCRDVQINSSVSMNLYDMDLIRKHELRFVSERYAVAEDYHFNTDYFHFAKRLAFTKEAGYFYFQNLDSICEKYSPQRFERTLNYYTIACERVERYGLKEQAGFRVQRSFLMKIRVAIRHIVLSDLDRSEKNRQIKQILHNEIVSEVLKSYPIEHYALSMRLMMWLMRKRNVRGVYVLMRLREKGRRTTGMKTVLRWIGIGR